MVFATKSCLFALIFWYCNLRMYLCKQIQYLVYYEKSSIFTGNDVGCFNGLQQREEIPC